MARSTYPEPLVFGLDIGTRSIVGTVGYREGKSGFKVVAQTVRLHETRAMMDGQIHDIAQVAESIKAVKKELEGMVGRKLTDVCIAAAGRVLQTVTTHAQIDYPEETVVDDEQVHNLEMIAIEMAYEELRKEKKSDEIKFYCVGYTVMQYYLNDYMILNLHGHKADRISADVLATFMPDEVVDGLYAAVEQAGLFVANLTLEPIAAINVAIPESYRLLNLALVDVGAGTSDISITKDGSIVAYGMMPYAGDEITETIVRKYLVDFNTAETIKLSCQSKKTITFQDIMGLTQKVSASDVIEAVSETVKMITQKVAEKIRQINGGKSVSAVFIVGGGGKLPGFTKYLAEFLELPPERVAIRGEEVMQEIEFLQEGIKKDSTLVTPIGICLNYYEQSNRFIFLNVNGERIKLYNNNKLTILDAAMSVGFPKEQLFPQRGASLEFTVDGKKRMIRGTVGEAAVIRLNGLDASFNTSISQNDKIELISSTMGTDAEQTIGQLKEYKSSIHFYFDGTLVECPKFAMVNGQLVSEFYSIHSGDEIQILDYYTVRQVLDFMDVQIEDQIYVNNRPGTMEEKVYENFAIDCKLKEDAHPNLAKELYELKQRMEEEGEAFDEEAKTPQSYDELAYDEEDEQTPESLADDGTDREAADGEAHNTKQTKEPRKEELPVKNMAVMVNGQAVVLTGKSEYRLVDVLDFYPFDVSSMKGSELYTSVNEVRAEFIDLIHENDKIEMYWKD